MPAGVSWSKYIVVSMASLLAMLAGSQTVHSVYRPLQNFDKLVEAEKERMRREAEEQVKNKNELSSYPSES